MNPTKILPPPVAMQFLARDARGYVVPFFVAWIAGKPDFRVADPMKLRRCIEDRLCWLCGGPLARYVAYVAGPMCGLNRTSAEPPSHLACAEYAAQVCPFLTMPKAQRREGNLPAHDEMAGKALLRNPGVALVWVTRDRLDPFQAPAAPGVNAGVLFHIGNPVDVKWFAEGRAATRAEVVASIESGLPALLEVAKLDQSGAVDELMRRKVELWELLPAEVPA